MVLSDGFIDLWDIMELWRDAKLNREANPLFLLPLPYPPRYSHVAKAMHKLCHVRYWLTTAGMHTLGYLRY